MHRLIRIVSTLVVALAAPVAAAQDVGASEHVSRGNALLLGEAHDYDQAIAEFTKAIRLDPKDADAYGGRGSAHYQKGEFDDAIADYTQEIRLDPNDALAFSGRAMAWDDKGEHDKAIADYTKAIRIDPKDASNYLLRGFAWSDKNEHEKAIADFTHAIRLDPTDPAAHAHRGVACCDVGKYGNAVADFEEAIRLDPDDPFPCERLAWLRATCATEKYRDGTKAVALARKACELTAWGEEDKLDTLAAAFAEDGDFDEAVKWEQKGISIAGAGALKTAMTERLDMFRKKTAYHEAAPTH